MITKAVISSVLLFVYLQNSDGIERPRIGDWPIIPIYRNESCSLNTSKDDAMKAANHLNESMRILITGNVSKIETYFQKFYDSVEQLVDNVYTSLKWETSQLLTTMKSIIQLGGNEGIKFERCEETFNQLEDSTKKTMTNITFCVNSIFRNSLKQMHQTVSLIESYQNNINLLYTRINLCEKTPSCNNCSVHEWYKSNIDQSDSLNTEIPQGIKKFVSLLNDYVKICLKNITDCIEDKPLQGVNVASNIWNDGIHCMLDKHIDDLNNKNFAILHC